MTHMTKTATRREQNVIRISTTHLEVVREFARANRLTITRALEVMVENFDTLTSRQKSAAIVNR